MSSHVFRQLCNTLRTQYGYNGTKRVCLEKSVAMTLVVLGHASGNRVVQDRFQYSGETVHRHVATVVTLLATIMAADIIKPADRYPMKRGFLAPYKGERYHIPEFQRGEELHRPEEKFDYFHSSLRSVIERTFGVWKNKWRILRSMPPFHIHTQCRIIVATMVLHNFIRARENNNVERSKFARGTYGRSEGGHYNAMAHVISIFNEAEMKEVRDNITALICRMCPS
ncbi:uncharacterized protein LOC142612470 [Castanea sativa]|uniref:uncharacterized protein LOC142612470 n=1 Tax=Castanea sativa TaxID=21020 RepID=UPI003F64A3E8